MVRRGEGGACVRQEVFYGKMEGVRAGVTEMKIENNRENEMVRKQVWKERDIEREGMIEGGGGVEYGKVLGRGRERMSEREKGKRKRGRESGE